MTPRTHTHAPHACAQKPTRHARPVSILLYKTLGSPGARLTPWKLRRLKALRSFRALAALGALRALTALTPLKAFIGLREFRRL